VFLHDDRPGEGLLAADPEKFSKGVDALVNVIIHQAIAPEASLASAAVAAQITGQKRRFPSVGRAGLSVRVTQVHPGRWKELRVTIRARPGRLSALSESLVIRQEEY
jgi:hypothetical protein